MSYSSMRRTCGAGHAKFRSFGIKHQAALNREPFLSERPQEIPGQFTTILKEARVLQLADCFSDTIPEILQQPCHGRTNHVLCTDISVENITSTDRNIPRSPHKRLDISRTPCVLTNSEIVLYE